MAGKALFLPDLLCQEIHDEPEFFPRFLRRLHECFMRFQDELGGRFLRRVQAAETDGGEESGAVLYAELAVQPQLAEGLQAFRGGIHEVEPPARVLASDLFVHGNEEPDERGVHVRAAGEVHVAFPAPAWSIQLGEKLFAQGVAIIGPYVSDRADDHAVRVGPQQ